MRIVQFFALFMVSINFSIAQNIGAEDNRIYGAALKVIISQEKPQNFFVWNQTIDGTTLLLSRVPRHAPGNQFVESLTGLPFVLQQQLQRESRSNLPSFNSDVNFVDANSLYSGDEKLAAIGFSKIIYDKKYNALLYTEICATHADTVCNGYGFWFFKTNGKWKILKQKNLWGGYSKPFWSSEIAK